MNRQGGTSSDTEAIVPVSSHEWRWLVFAVVIGAILRLLFLDRVAVEHFDEGVYAANVWFGMDEGYQYPLRQFYAPPLLPALIEWCYVLWGLIGLTPPAWLPMVPSLVCGIATIPSAWWVARRWFGPTAGYAAMWLVALNEFHAAYSRTALTDVPVTLAILWAVFAAWKLLLEPTVKNGVVTGILTAIAWWLKYSGWLPLAILLVGGAVFQCLIRPQERRWKAWGLAIAIAILTAGVLWLPVWRDCLAVGGYSAVAANHRGYIMGWSSWGKNFTTVLSQYGHYHVLTGLGLMCTMIPLGPVVWWTPRGSRFASILFLIAFLGWGLPELLWLLLMFGAVSCIGLGLQAWSRGELPRWEIAAAALLCTWFCGLFLTTPLYQPYPRLLLPWWMAATLLMAWCMQLLTVRMPESDHMSATPITTRELFQGGTLLAVMILLAWISDVHLWEDRQRFTAAANEFAKELRSHSDTPIVQVYGLPPVVLALRERGVAAVVCGGPEAAARLDGSWLVVSSDADRDSTWNDHWSQVADRFELVSTLPVDPSSIVRLDQGPMPVDPPPVELRLYRRK